MYLLLQREEELLYEFQPACTLGVKLAGVHWWHKSRSRAAELTAGGAHAGMVLCVHVCSKYCPAASRHLCGICLCFVCQLN
jgi:hypothetical protein